MGGQGLNVSKLEYFGCDPKLLKGLRTLTVPRTTTKYQKVAYLGAVRAFDVKACFSSGIIWSLILDCACLAIHICQIIHCSPGSAGWTVDVSLALCKQSGLFQDTRNKALNIQTDIVCSDRFWHMPRMARI